MASQVSFDDKNSELNSSLAKKNARSKNHLTQKYDPKRTRRRLEVEEWMDQELRELYECDEDEDYDVEIDLDNLLEVAEEDRYTAIEKILEEAKNPTDEFIKELLEKIKKL
ncbi:protein phosphatase 1 regulatory subunit 14C-like [Ptychodera flava]|uniref:protein phosphatase 1 regulatory subunit 14C-like n=1 Tax=Ptychodera flava TaxID=63121 RepID=UPI00396A43A6